jgi:hypothetical protein
MRHAVPLEETPAPAAKWRAPLGLDAAVEPQVAARGALGDAMRHTVPLEETPMLAAKWCALLGLDAAAEFEPSGDERLFPNRVSISGADAALLLAGKPHQPLDALQYLLHEAQGERDDDRLACLDALGARLFRMKELVAMAGLAAGKARETGSFAFGPLTPKERRWIHITLDGEGDLETRSEGLGTVRSLKVVRKG